MLFLAAGKRDHLARLGEGGGESELNGQCPFKRIYFFMDVVPKWDFAWGGYKIIQHIKVRNCSLSQFYMFVLFHFDILHWKQMVRSCR